MFASLCILGRQPALGLAELESLYGAKAVMPVNGVAALLDKNPAEIAFAYLGGTVKFCKVLTELDTASWKDVHKYLVGAVPEHAKLLPEGKLSLGLSVYGFSLSTNQVTGSALELKKVLKNERPVRVVPNKELALNSAQVLHNKLTDRLGWELVFVKNGSKTIVAQTIAVQDIEAYARRDQGRPKRDSKVGMLPPKLAQIIINLATGATLPPNCGPANQAGQTILDPFCGTGVILQEAILMGYSAYGTDLEPRMVEYSKANLDWLITNLKLQTNNYPLETADATGYHWNIKFDYVASETYLGKPFTATPSAEVLRQTIHEVNTITKKFIKNLASQTSAGFRLCLALPAWHIAGEVKHLPLLDQLTDMGYNRLTFKFAENKDLIYRREGQIVGRELITLTRS